ncbi:DNA/RNA nuclease SfsA [Cellulosilyticum ruminicola]|uniref:DNA/RNA nuclease SfsA n=1 Tax=Cellulosilyticum ruminicola TaxID=425254 RepID=UPI0006D23DA0|nr:DNA/RNA nuclease SfsA [Cellulosilyticum ruminicola]
MYIDSQLPNTVFEEAIKNGVIKLPDMGEPLTQIKREKTYGNSRFDFYLESVHEKAFMEIKGATIEQEDYVLFVIQIGEMEYFTFHVARNPKFAKALYKASKKGVKILAYEYKVMEDTLEVTKQLPVQLPKL